MAKYYLAIPLFIFLILIISSPTYAAVDVNQTIKVGGASPNMMRCINSTDNQIYCYIWSVESVTFVNKFVRLNATGLNQTNCTMTNYTSAPASSRTMINLLNATHILTRKDDSGCDVWNISDLGNGGTCFMEKHYSNAAYQCQQMMFESEDAMFAANPTDIYTLSGGGPTMPVYVIQQSNFTNFTAGWWNKTIYFNGTFVEAKILNIPDKTVNILYETSHGYSKPINPPFLKYVSGELERIIDSPLDNETICTNGTITTTRCANDMVKSGSEIYLFAFDNTKDRIYRLNFSGYENLSSECNIPFGANYHIGTTCIDSTTYVTNPDNCTVTTANCPSGTACQQLTPQINVTNDLVENYTSCQIRTTLGFTMFCTNVCWRGNVMWSNCVEEPCKVCPETSTGSFTLNGTLGYYTNTYYSNQSTVSVPSYTIACMNYTSGVAQFVIDANGNNTTVIELLTQAGNNVTEIIYNTTSTEEATSTSNVVSTSWFGVIALGIGSIFGMGTLQYLDVDIAMLSIILSMAIGFIALYVSRKGEVFGFGFIGTLMIFTIGLGNIYLWLVFGILIVLVAGIMTGAFRKIIGGG